MTTFEAIKANSVRGSIIGLGGELYVYKKFCTVTGGMFFTIFTAIFRIIFDLKFEFFYIENLNFKGFSI